MSINEITEKITHHITKAAEGEMLNGNITQSMMVAEVMATKIMRNITASDLFASLAGRN